MNRERLAAAFAAAIDEHRLLDHPFYLRWSRGEVGLGELRAYAGQYRHFEAMIPGHLSAVARSAGEATELGRQALRNLADEAGGPVSHLALFDRFAGAVGARDDEPGPAMRALLAVYRDCREAGAVAGFAALTAYELQAAAVASTKAAGLRLLGLVDEEALAFWDVHAGLDVDHADWAVTALAAVVERPDPVVAPASLAARAWWEFLDEREAVRPGGPLRGAPVPAAGS